MEFSNVMGDQQLQEEVDDLGRAIAHRNNSFDILLALMFSETLISSAFQKTSALKRNMPRNALYWTFD
jgi:hypothetical protein